ncbi:MAG: hypothetical protein AAF298_11040 [Cyanobacteria bacterium P01_A01_bin.40]
MGTLRDTIKTVDSTPGKTEEMTLALNLLSELATQKAIQFKTDLTESLRTAGSPENRTIPITEIISWRSESRAYVEDNSGKLSDEIKGSLTDFLGVFTGDSEIKDKATKVVDGMTRLLTTALEALLGSASGREETRSMYYVIVDGLAITRIDISVWSRKIEAKGITEYIQNAMVFQAVKSSVDVNKISFNTFLQAYKAQLAGMKLPEEELMTYIKSAKEVFNILRDDSVSSSQSTQDLAQYKSRQLIQSAQESISPLWLPGVIRKL